MSVYAVLLMVKSIKSEACRKSATSCTTNEQNRK